MKKLFLIVAAMFAVVSFSACSDDDKDDSLPITTAILQELGKLLLTRVGQLIAMERETIGLMFTPMFQMAIIIGLIHLIRMELAYVKVMPIIKKTKIYQITLPIPSLVILSQ
nr:hypothetical protein [Alistipes onderdonkii]